MLPSFPPPSFYHLPTSILVGFFHTVELLDAAQDILKSSSDLQAVINEAADLAKEVMELKKAHAEELEKRDLAHATELNKLTGQLKALGDNLAEVTTNADAQQRQQAEAVKLAEQTLAAHLDEVNAIHDHVLGKTFPLLLVHHHLSYLLPHPTHVCFL